MKNQYFGDNRDLFKYDLILRVIKETNSIDHFTFIPMLTEDDDTGQGEERNRKKARAGTENNDLVNFLDEFEEKSKRDIKHLKSFFGKQAIEMTIYHGKNKYFSHLQRGEYFKQIDDRLLSKSLVFVDPDKGLEIGRTREKHIRYKEVKKLYENMDDKSVLMIFQYFPRNEKHEKYLDRRSQELKDWTRGDLPIYIHDRKAIFLLLPRDKSLKKSLAKTISAYEKDYSRLYVGGIS